MTSLYVNLSICLCVLVTMIILATLTFTVVSSLLPQYLSNEDGREIP